MASQIEMFHEPEMRPTLHVGQVWKDLYGSNWSIVSLFNIPLDDRVIEGVTIIRAEDSQLRAIHTKSLRKKYRCILR